MSMQVRELLCLATSSNKFSVKSKTTTTNITKENKVRKHNMEIKHVCVYSFKDSFNADVTRPLNNPPKFVFEDYLRSDN